MKNFKQYTYPYFKSPTQGCINGNFNFVVNRFFPPHYPIVERLQSI